MDLSPIGRSLEMKAILRPVQLHFDTHSHIQTFSRSQCCPRFRRYLDTPKNNVKPHTFPLEPITHMIPHAVPYHAGEHNFKSPTSSNIRQMFKMGPFFYRLPHGSDTHTRSGYQNSWDADILLLTAAPASAHRPHVPIIHPGGVAAVPV